MANAPNQNFIKNQELENTVELLVSRVRHLELSKSQQSVGYIYFTSTVGTNLTI